MTSAIVLVFTLTVVAGCRRSTLFCIWGFLLPIWSVPGISPVVFDLARVIVAVTIMVRVPIALDIQVRRRIHGVSVVLLAGAVLVASGGALTSDSGQLRLGVTMAIALATSAVVVSRAKDSVRHLLSGYVLGVMLSSVVLISTAVGGPDFSAQTTPGMTRATGLAPSAPLVGYQIALALAICVVVTHQRHKILRLVSMATLLSALLMSGGRGGLAALLVLGIAAARWKQLRIGHAVLLLAGLTGLVYVAAQLGFWFNTLERLRGSESLGGTSSGRDVLFVESLRSVASQPVLGEGMQSFSGRYGLTPHLAPLNFAVSGGVVCGLLILGLCLWLGRQAFIAHPPKAGLGSCTPLVAGVLFAWPLLEPTGPFVGAEGLSLLLLVATGMNMPVRLRSDRHPPAEGSMSGDGKVRVGNA